MSSKDTPADAPSGPLMPLAMADEGQEVELVSLTGGRQFQHRLAEMGLVPGAKFRVLTNTRPGPLIISLRGARLMIGYGMVHRVLVRPAV